MCNNIKDKYNLKKYRPQTVEGRLYTKVKVKVKVEVKVKVKESLMKSKKRGNACSLVFFIHQSL